MSEKKKEAPKRPLCTLCQVRRMAADNGTGFCDWCWEIDHRIRAFLVEDPDRARAYLKDLLAETKGT